MRVCVRERERDGGREGNTFCRGQEGVLDIVPGKGGIGLYRVRARYGEREKREGVEKIG